MVVKPDIITATGLEFFGKIAASISHELKNVLAIINENAGLLEDLALMAERGQPLDPARLKKMAATVKGKIGRADEILKTLNRFGHSIDGTIAPIDLGLTIQLFMALTERFTAMRGVQVDLQLPESSPQIATAPFFLINFLWLCLDRCMTAGGDEKRVELIVAETASGARIRFRPLAGLNEELWQALQSEREQRLLDMLAANLTVTPDRREIVLELKRRIDK